MTTPTGAHLTKAESKQIRDTLLHLASRVGDIAALTIGRDAKPGSPAKHQLDSDVNDISAAGGSRVRHAQVAALYPLLSAEDHMRAFEAVLRTRTLTVTLATLTRAIVEAFGKAFYLLSSDDAGELLRRHASLNRMEIKSVNKHVQFQTMERKAVDVDTYVQGLIGEVDEAGLEPPESIRITTIATTVLKDGNTDGLGAGHYAQLSAIAHANAAAIGMHLAYEVGDVHLALPRVLVLEQLAMILGTCKSAIRQLLDLYQPEKEIREAWHKAAQDADRLIINFQEDATA